MILPIEDALTAELPTFLPRQRWYGDKGRLATSHRIRATDRISLSGDAELLPIAVDVTFASGPNSVYFVPVITDRTSRHRSGVICTMDDERGELSLFDAPHDFRFRTWLGETIAQERHPTEIGWNPGAVPPSTARAVLRASTSVGLAEQSNTNVLFDTTAIAKIYRRLQPGINPEIELVRFLTLEAGFPYVPPYLGSWELPVADCGPSSLAIVQGWVPNQGDCWSALLSMLRRGIERSDWIDADALPSLLGMRTALLHLALSSHASNPDIAPEPIATDDIARWTSAVGTRVAALEPVLAEVSALDARTADLAAAVRASWPRLSNRAAGFHNLLGAQKTRVHGDFHLGQILHTLDADIAFVDFEGEPSRPLDHRRAKTSPLKDVAGMLRSFSYARATAAQAFELDSEHEPHRGRLAEWEQAARSVFVQRYVEVARSGGARFLPAGDRDLKSALAAWEFDKALYEIDYERNNRPDWLWLPLSGLLGLA